MLTIIARNLGHNQLAAGAKQGSSRAAQTSTHLHDFFSSKCPAIYPKLDCQTFFSIFWPTKKLTTKIPLFSHAYRMDETVSAHKGLRARVYRFRGFFRLIWAKIVLQRSYCIFVIIKIFLGNLTNTFYQKNPKRMLINYDDAAFFTVIPQFVQIPHFIIPAFTYSRVLSKPYHKFQHSRL